uniref:Uncharacterized protein n=1 Tax=Glossina palpalis gambiensis TaxID=67801 RepID=A0A1B0BT84_9MUSC
MPSGLRFFVFLWITFANSWISYTTITNSRSSSLGIGSGISAAANTRHFGLMMGVQAQPSLTEKIPLGK